MTIQAALTPQQLAPPPTENVGASYLGASRQVAARTIKKFVRSPQLIIAGTAQGTLFLLIFRYVFGGAVGHTGSFPYVDFLVPGFVVTGVLFSGMGAATGIAEDLQGGLFDRLRSLPIRLLSIVTGRVAADTATVVWGLTITTAIGVLIGFRVQDGAMHAVEAFALTALFGFVFCWMFIGLGLAAGSPQGAQGIAFLVFPLSFVSSAYVPVATMPGWMQAFANHQPLTYMSNSVRLLTGGHPMQQLLGQTLGANLWPSLAWSAGIVLVFAPFTVHRLQRG
jgi:ABC-2 type transport system permease protein